MATESLELRNGGPVRYFKIDFSAGFGVYELNGSKGVGKTTILKSIDLVGGHKVEITVTDGELSGEVRGFGVIAPLGGKKRRKGDLSVAMVDSERFTLADLVDPPFKDANARDRHRIKASLALRGVMAEQADFYELVGGKDKLEALLPKEKLETDDPVVLASRIKDALEDRARQFESTRDHEKGHADACRENPEQIDTTSPHDSSELQHAYDAAKERQLELKQKTEAAESDQQRRSQATEAHAKAVAGYCGLTISEADQAFQDLTLSKNLSVAKIAELEKALAEAKSHDDVLRVQVESAEKTLKAAQSHHETCQSWKETIDSKPLVAPSAEETTAADNLLRRAKEDLEYGVKVRKVLEDEGRAKVHQASSDEAAKAAQQYRELAAQSLDVLTKLVECPGIRIESVDGHPRFVVDHPKRGKCLFDELSDGERVRYSIDATLVKLDGPALAPIPQRVFQDLPPQDRKELHQFCKDRKIYAVGAQVTDGELRVEYFGSGFTKVKS